MRVVSQPGTHVPTDISPAGVEVPATSGVALYASDYPALKPALLVQQGDAVQAGQALFRDRHREAIRFLSPVTGRVAAVHTGRGRRLQAMVIERTGESPGEIEWSDAVAGCRELALLPLDELRRRLLDSGLWAAIRQRPGDLIAPPEGLADAVLITAIDTEPGAPKPARVLEGRWNAFWLGVAALARFAGGPVWVCAAGDFAEVPGEVGSVGRTAIFDGPHPAGLPGTHIGRLTPLSPDRHVWHVGYQDVAAIGHLLLTGRLQLTRVFAMAGPGAVRPGLLRLPLGARVTDLPGTAGRMLICGSPLSGRLADGHFEFLGRFHRQVTVLGGNPAAAAISTAGSRFATMGIVDPRRPRAPAGGMLAHDGLDRCWVHDSPPAPLLRALMTGDHQRAIELGCLDLGEEDLALASAHCPGGHDYGAYLREALDAIQRELQT